MQQSLIAILDILGTKGAWNQGIIDQYFQAIDDSNAILEEARARFKKQSEGVPIEVDFLSFSDTMVVTLMKTEKDEEKDPYFFDMFIGPFSQMILGIFQVYFSKYFFMRGAISYGLMDKRGNHFVGEAVDDAAEYFELPDIIGVCLTPKATIAMKSAIVWNRKYFQKEICDHLIMYKTPLKTKQEIDLYQVNWANHFFERAEEPGASSAEASLSRFLSHRNIPLVATNKYTNSLNFLREVGKVHK